MRPLNRPMFRYGGPIKEGVMSGIREPHKNGQRVGAGLVGDQRYPQTGGREHHWAFMPWLVGAGLTAARAAARPFGTWAMKNVPKMFSGPQRNWAIGKGFSSTPGYTKNVAQNVFTPNKFGKYLLGSPEGRLLTGGAGWAGKVGKGIYAAGKGIAKSPLTVGGLVYMGGKWFNKKGEVVPPPRSTGGNTVGPQHPSNNPDLYGGLKTAEDAAKAKLAAEKLRKDRIQKYRDIVDIKGMNREAAGKSLIEASRLINESQDFKGDIRSGKLINRIIQGASKAYDKPADMRRAIDTLILKSEIQKDLEAETKEQDKRHKESVIAINEAKLAENTLAGDIRKYTSTNKTLPAGNTLAGFATGRGYPIKGVEDTTIVKNWMKKNNGTEVKYLQYKITDKEVAPGLYVINDKILRIDENKRVTPVSTSAM